MGVQVNTVPIRQIYILLAKFICFTFWKEPRRLFFFFPSFAFLSALPPPKPPPHGVPAPAKRRGGAGRGKPPRRRDAGIWREGGWDLKAPGLGNGRRNGRRCGGRGGTAGGAEGRPRGSGSRATGKLDTQTDPAGPPPRARQCVFARAGGAEHRAGPPADACGAGLAPYPCPRRETRCPAAAQRPVGLRPAGSEP